MSFLLINKSMTSHNNFLVLKNYVSWLTYCLVLVFCFMLGACVQPGPPKLPDTKPETASSQSTAYTRALKDMNLLLDVYLPPAQCDFLYYVKPIIDKTYIAVSSGGEIPSDMGDMVRAAFGDIHNGIRVLEQYTDVDMTQIQVELQKGIATKPREQDIRPKPNFIVSGSISVFDRGLESVSRTPKLLGNISSGDIDLNAETKKETTKSHLGVILLVSSPDGISLPGRFGAEMDVWNSKDGVNVGFAIKGIGFGYTAEGVAIQGRHQALRLIADLSVVQIVGRTLSLPYWRVPLAQSPSSKIYEEDEIVYRDWRQEYGNRISNRSLIPYMQSACIANGDDSVQVTGIAEEPGFQAALTHFAEKYHVREQNNQQYPQYPSFELFKSLEMNRILDRSRAALAWNALNAFQSRNVASSIISPSKALSPTEQSAVEVQPTPKPRRVKPSPAQPVLPDDLDAKMEGLL
ncbi:MAG: hypothetical protein LBU39_09085 [Desulfobulbaceae bacterium]|jgi:hypothetical protein|nr:hypothetical protein [Desulfobulbaceae bacterium]